MLFFTFYLSPNLYPFPENGTKPTSFVFLKLFYISLFLVVCLMLGVMLGVLDDVGGVGGDVALGVVFSLWFHVINRLIKI